MEYQLTNSAKTDILDQIGDSSVIFLNMDVRLCSVLRKEDYGKVKITEMAKTR